MRNNKSHPLMHIARIKKGGRPVYLLLRRSADNRYEWFAEKNGEEIPEEVSAGSIAEALRAAVKKWKTDHAFETLRCGFRFTLPERDEHGSNALFHQMAASLETINGIYFDEDLGHACIVHNMSIEARQLWKILKTQNRL